MGISCHAYLFSITLPKYIQGSGSLRYELVTVGCACCVGAGLEYYVCLLAALWTLRVLLRALPYPALSTADM